MPSFGRGPVGSRLVCPCLTITNSPLGTQTMPTGADCVSRADDAVVSGTVTMPGARCAGRACPDGVVDRLKLKK